jgi:hypothetical protein
MHDIMILTLHGGGQGFESPRLHSFFDVIYRRNVRILDERAIRFVLCDTNLTSIHQAR